jgi:outer membrane murein-binding lipoprotein Lpp
VLIRRVTAVFAALAVLAGCSAEIPDRRADAEALAAQIRELPGVVTATSDTWHSLAQGPI